mgnify:CR=1 FL=1
MIDKSSYMSFAADIYDNPGCMDAKEFEYDARRPLRIKFMLRKWVEEQRQIDVRHLLNHMVIMRNCFSDNSSDMIAMYCEKFLPLLMPFFDYLGYAPTFFSFEGKTIVTDQIDRDAFMVKTIKEMAL